MPNRGNGTYPPNWTPLTGHHYVDHTTASHGERLAVLETRVDGLEDDQTRISEVLTTLREAFVERAGRSIATIIRQRWDEILPYLIAAGALAWGNQEMVTRWAFWVLGISPD